MEKHYRIKEEFWTAWGVNCEEDAIIDVCTLNSHARKSGIRQHLLLAQVEDIVDEPAYRTPYEFISDLFDSGYSFSIHIFYQLKFNIYLFFIFFFYKFIFLFLLIF